MALDLSSKVLRPSQAAKLNLALLYGPPGGGKTTFAASAVLEPSLSPVLIIDTEGSTYGTLTQYSDHDDEIVIIPAKEFEDFQEVIKATLKGELEVGGKPFTPKTVIVDTMDVIQERALAAIEESLGDDTNGFKKYGMLKEWSNNLVERFRDADFLGVIVTHMKRTELEEGGYFDGINLVGGSKDTIPGLPDLVAYVSRHEGVTTAHFESSKKRVSKNRHGLPPTMDDPDFSKVYSIAVTNKKKEDK